MRTIALVGAVAMLLAGTAMGASTVAFDVQVGGNNHAADWEAGQNPAFTPGVDSGYVLTKVEGDSTSSILTWNVNAAVSGTDADGITPVQGIACMVFDLTLKDAAGNAVAGAVFLSRINDGNNVGDRYALEGSDILEKAAWCMGWDVDLDYGQGGDGTPDGLGPPAGPGRLFDPTTAGGPFMDRVQFPSTSDFGGGHMKNGEGEGSYVAGSAMTTSAGAGTLLGTGIGYSQLSLATAGSANCLGVGLTFGSLLPFWGSEVMHVGIGAGPAAEGQIDMAALDSGIYTLELTAPAAGQNVVKGAYDATSGATGGFAAKADNVIVDSVTFTWDAGIIPPTPATPTAWASVKTHTRTGVTPVDYAIPLNFAAGSNATAESRTGGIQKIVVTFDNPPILAEPAANIQISPAMTVVSQAVSGNDLIVTVSGAAEYTCYTFDLTGVLSNLAATADATCKVVNNVGDGNNSRSITTADYTGVKNRLGLPVDASNCRFDINHDQQFTTADYTAIKNRLANGTALACPN